MLDLTFDSVQSNVSILRSIKVIANLRHGSRAGDLGADALRGRGGGRAQLPAGRGELSRVPGGPEHAATQARGVARRDALRSQQEAVAGHAGGRVSAGADAGGAARDR